MGTETGVVAGFPCGDAKLEAQKRKLNPERTPDVPTLAEMTDKALEFL